MYYFYFLSRIKATLWWPGERTGWKSSERTHSDSRWSQGGDKQNAESSGSGKQISFMTSQDVSPNHWQSP